MMLSFLLYWAWFFAHMTWNRPSGEFPMHAYTGYCFWLLAGLGLEWLNRDKAEATLYEISLLKHLPIASRQTAYAFVALLIYLAFSKDRFISRAFLFSLLPLEYLLLLWTNYALPERFVRGVFRRRRDIRTLLIGHTSAVEKLQPWLDRKTRFGFDTVGILTTELAPQETSYPVLGTISELGKIVARENIKQVILMDFLKEPDHYRRLIDKVEACGVRVLLVSNVEELLQRKVSVLEDDGCRFIALREEPLENPANRALKRALDLAVALPIVVFVLPWLSVFVWVLHRFQSPGPLFHRQTRAGIQNSEFTIIKFRTMHEGNTELEKQATQNDARVFPAGKWLRKLGIDEFPQFLNVVLGEMSVVGPRPHLLLHNEGFARVMSGYHLRTFVKPGITGLAQVRGFHGEANTIEDIQARLQSDMVYLENWSTPLDIAIILRTGWQMIFPARKPVAPPATAATEESLAEIFPLLGK